MWSCHDGVIIGDETELSTFVFQHNVLSDVYFCDVRFCVVSLQNAEQSDLLLLSSYPCFGILYYFIGLRCSSFCDLQTIANDVGKAEKLIFLPGMHSEVSTKCDNSSLFQYFYLLFIQFMDKFLCIFVQIFSWVFNIVLIKNLLPK